MSKVRTPEPEGFSDYWKIWLPIARHTDGRGLARETYRKHVLMGADPQDIIDGARWYSRNLKENERAYVPLSSTWLNRESYLDLCDKERAFQDRMAGHQAAPTSNVTPIRRAAPEKPTVDYEARARRVQQVMASAGLAAGE